MQCSIGNFRLAAFLLLLLIAAVIVGCFTRGFLRSADSELFIMEPKADHNATVIFLHGLGDTGNKVASIFEGIKQTHIKYVFPTAQEMPVTVNHGMIMHSWFDVEGLSSTSNEDEASIEAAARLLQTLIAEQEKLGIKRDRIVVGGISQGGATCLYSLLAIPQMPVAGIFGLSTWLPLHKTFPEAAKANMETPVLLCHGDADHTVALEFGQLTAEMIKTFNKKVEFNIYPGLAHWVNDKEMQDVKKFIDKCLPR